MKAKVINPKSKYYGRIVNMRKMANTQFFANRYEMVYGKGLFFGDELDFNIDPVNNPVSFDWSSFRREAAKDILPAVIAKKSSMCNYDEVVNEAIMFADELIRQLKDE